MLDQVSWADYISTIITLTILYYLFAGSHYYGKDLLCYISNRNRSNSNEMSFTAESKALSIPDELQAYIAEARNADSEMVLSGMRSILQRCEVDDAIKIKINSYIKDHCSVRLTEEEMQGIWTR